MGCATLCQNHVGDPIDVSGEAFVDLVTEYLEQENNPISNSTTIDSVSCSATPICQNEGLTGACCPTIDNIFLDCCEIGEDGNSTDIGGNSTDPNVLPGDIKLLYGEISCWDVSDVTDMSGAFAFQEDFEEEVGCWNVRSVTDMSNMFLSATKFNEDLNIWSDVVPRENIETTDMFKNSGCDVQSDPDTIGRPWCQFKQPEFSTEFKCFFFGDC